MGSGSKPASASIMRVWQEQGQERGQLQWPHRVTPAWRGPQGPAGVSGQAVGAADLVLGLSLSSSENSWAQWGQHRGQTRISIRKCNLQGFFLPLKRCFPH